MATAFPKYVPALLLLATAAIACSESSLPASPTETTVTQVMTARPVTAEPVTARAELLAGRPCATPPFGVRIVLGLSDGVVLVRRLRLELTHPTGRRTVPLAMPILTSPTTPLPTPTHGPIPVPTMAGLPVPSPAPIEDMLLTVRRLPLFLEFACGVAPAGTLVATVDTTDDQGQSQTSVLRVTVGR